MRQQKISFEQAEEIRRHYKKFCDVYGVKARLAKRYNVSYKTILRIIQGESHLRERPKRDPKPYRQRLSSDDVTLIRQMASLRMWSNVAIGEQFNITGKHVGDIVARNSWKQIP